MAATAVPQLAAIRAEAFARPDEHLTAKATANLKALFDCLQAQSVAQGGDPSLLTLYTDGFDTEQLWSMVELDHEKLVWRLEQQVDELAALPHGTVANLLRNGDLSGSDDDDASDDVSDDVSDEEEDEEEDEDEESSEDEESIGGAGGENDRDRGLINDAKMNSRTDGAVTRDEVEDEFFSLEAMDRFAEEAEEAEEHRAKRGRPRPDSAEDEDADDGVELDDVHNNPDLSALYSSEAQERGVAGDDDSYHGSDDDLRYSDFFGQDTEASAPASPTADLGNSAKPSAHERRQAKMREKIAALEEEAMSNKPWELTGEVMARSRPENSLLEVGDVDVTYVARSAPTVTAETTETIEDIIKRRIRDEDFDDVVRRLPPAQDAEFRPQAELSMEKSRHGLGEEYAKEYEQQVLGTASEGDAARDKERGEIEGMFKQLCVRLDALSNFHFAPRPVQPEANVVPQVPALQMEEALPTAVSAAAHAAPEEILRPKRGREGVGKSNEELDRTDRKRLRQASKAARRKRRAADTAARRVESRLHSGKAMATSSPADVKAARDLRTAKRGEEEGAQQTRWGKSTEVFARMQSDKEDAAGAAKAARGGAKKSKKRDGSAKGGASFKL